MTARNRAALLWILLAAFASRVLGQVYVGLYAPDWLPTWEEWYSGLLPYPALLPVQILMLMAMAVVNTDYSRGCGRFIVESDTLRRGLRIVAAIYAAVMILRYGLTMILRPELRWFGGTIPIFFHWVLAGYIWTLTVPARTSGLVR